MTNILNGKALSLSLQQELKKSINALTTRKPTLAFILVGHHPPSLIYVERKKKATAFVGIRSIISHLNENISEKMLIQQIQKYNNDPSIDGILVQMPLPPSISPYPVIQAIHPNKDVDGFHPLNFGKLLLGEKDGFIPCTPLGIQCLLEKNQIAIESKHVVIVGRSNIVGKPLAALLMQKKKGANATVTIAHSQSKDLHKITQEADILVSAIGKPRFLTQNMVKKGCVVVDVGITQVQGKLVGDVDYEKVAPITAAITPVPGGIGPMTIAMLLKNTYLSFQRREKR